ncbi:hypothetical protein WAI453_009372 [Rhynchosporium graminicola]
MRSCCLITAVVLGLSALTAAQHSVGGPCKSVGACISGICRKNYGSCRNTAKGICLRYQAKLERRLLYKKSCDWWLEPVVLLSVYKLHPAPVHNSDQLTMLPLSRHIHLLSASILLLNSNPRRARLACVV